MNGQQQAEQELAEADKSLAAVDDELREVERSRAELRSRMASLETTLRHHAAREAELETESSRLHRQQAVMDSRVSEAEKEQTHLENVLRLEQQRFEERQAEQEANAAKSSELHSSLDVAQESIEKLRQAAIAQGETNATLSTALTGLRHEQHSLKQRRHELTEARDVLAAELTELQTEVDNCQLRADAAQQLVTQAEEAADRVLTNRESLLNEQTASRETLAELREQRSAALARRTVLEDLEDRQEGFGIGAREILRRAEEGRSEPWNLIRGSVADLLDVDMENAALLEVALSGRAQLLVIDKLEPLVRYLNSGRCQITGRVGFVSLEDSGTVMRQVSIEHDRPTASEDLMSAPDLSQSPGWNGDLGLGMFGDDWLEGQFDTSVTDEFVPDLKVTWVDEKR